MTILVKLRQLLLPAYLGQSTKRRLCLIESKIGQGGAEGEGEEESKQEGSVSGASLRKYAWRGRQKWETCMKWASWRRCVARGGVGRGVDEEQEELDEQLARGSMQVGGVGRQKKWLGMGGVQSWRMNRQVAPAGRGLSQARGRGKQEEPADKAAR